FFCLLSSCDHLVLLIFPTRRSSDLLRLDVAFSGTSAILVRPDAGGARAGSLGPARGLRPPARLSHCPKTAHGTCHRHRPWHHQQDRKSTRLNSSHVKISYAVFCLKK